ncbi:hypothetical protein RJ639_038806 [Escallonia herrerae]|uniref:Pentatricopeptide repeat-containing protein n=1 Tax=Escallonia herrerae TaxID=1293975 RepID=A0AA88X195_9ASTE|nr:hypothetical protein RJ639_038806 [Escallonia herrerae]
MLAPPPPTSSPYPPKPQQVCLQWKTKPPNKILSSSSELLVSRRNPNCNATQLSVPSNASTHDKTLLHRDWPALLQISIGSGDVNLGSCTPGFDEMLDRNTITWTSLINGYSLTNDAESVYRIAYQMHKLGKEFNEHTWSVILKACESRNDQINGELIHGLLIKSGVCEDVVVGTSLISMYSKSGYFENAERLFIDMTYRDVQCLNLMISEYGRAGCNEKAIRVMIELLNLGLEPNDYTLTNVLSTCNGDRDVEEGRQLHGLAIKHGFVAKSSVGNVMITMYGYYGLVEEAENGEKALRGFLEMMMFGIYPDSGCLATVLDGCLETKNLELGLQIHGMIVKLGLLLNVRVGTALVDLYAKCGKLRSARLLLNILNTLNTASFNAILIRFMEVQGDNGEDAMALFIEHRVAGLHVVAIKMGFVDDIMVANALITMYGKCGSIEDACYVFNGMNGHDSVSWNAMVSAYALNGQGRKAITLFEGMMKQGFAPDGIMILGVLQACVYCGLWEYGFSLFSAMEVKLGIRPVIEHYTRMVNLLGRSGFFREALEFINRSPFSDSPLLWRTLVHVCKLQGDLRFGKIASTHLLDLAPEEAGSYILATNMFSGGGMLDEASRVRTRMNDLKVSKEVGCSWIEIDNKTRQSSASSKDHPESRDIYAKLELLEAEMRQSSDEAFLE